MFMLNKNPAMVITRKNHKNSVSRYHSFAKLQHPLTVSDIISFFNP